MDASAYSGKCYNSLIRYMNIVIESIDNEIWKPVVGYEGMYEVSNLGRLKSVLRVHITSNGRMRAIKPILVSIRLSNAGYCKACLFNNTGGKYTPFVHRLVAMAFIENKENKNTINHKNGIKNDNRVENLEWMTQKENVNHSISSGLTKIRHGTSIHTSVLKEIDVIEIKKKILNGECVGIIAKQYNISQSVISKIKHGYSWKRVQL